MGLLEPGDVTAQWIGLDGEMIYPGHESENNPPLACPLFRKEFKVAVPIRRATLYASALGVYRFHINGRPVGDDLFHARLDRLSQAGLLQHLRRDRHDRDRRSERHRRHLGRRLVRRRHRLGIASLSIRPAPAAVCPARDRAGRRHDPDRGDRRVLEDGLRPAGQGEFLAGETYDARKEIPAGTAGLDDSAWKPVATGCDPGFSPVVAGRRRPACDRQPERQATPEVPGFRPFPA